MDEMFKMLTWAQLGLHRYPCAFFDVRGYYHALRGMMDHMVTEGFVKPAQRDSVWFGDAMPALFDWMASYDGGTASRVIGPASVKA